MIRQVRAPDTESEPDEDADARVVDLRPTNRATVRLVRAPQAEVLGWTRVAKCGWCRVGLREPALLAEIHETHVRVGLGARELQKLALRRLAHEEHEPVPSHRALGRHLAEHLDRAAFEKAADHEEPEPQEPGVELEEIRHARKLLARLRRRLDQLEVAAELEPELDGHRVALMSGLVNSSRGLIDTILKSRGMAESQAKSAKYAATVAVTTLIGSLAEPIGEIAAVAEKRGCLDVADRLRGLGAEGGTLRSGARSAVETATQATLEAAYVS